jgi:hypothetical protein
MNIAQHEKEMITPWPNKLAPGKTEIWANKNLRQWAALLRKKTGGDWNPDAWTTLAQATNKPKSVGQNRICQRNGNIETKRTAELD